MSQHLLSRRGAGATTIIAIVAVIALLIAVYVLFFRTSPADPVELNVTLPGGEAAQPLSR